MHGLTLFFHFIIYSMIGWIGEVCFAFFVHRRFINRGFLNGPLCPMYGIGALLFIAIGEVMPQKIWILFIASAIAATTLEYSTGALLERIFHRRYWDYSHTKFNINGYVTLPASIAWGVIGVVAVLWIHPTMTRIVTKIPLLWRNVLTLVFLWIFIADLSITVAQNLQLSKRLERLKTLSEKLADTLQQESERRKLEKEYRHILVAQSFGTQRILAAFPNLKSRKHDRAVYTLREMQLSILDQFKAAKEKYRQELIELKECQEKQRQENTRSIGRATLKEKYKMERLALKKRYNEKRNALKKNFYQKISENLNIDQ